MGIDLKPTVCNICGGPVEFVPESEVYKRPLKYSHTSGFCYHCTKCGALVGTHKDRPDVALGLLADKELSKLRIRAHNMFDKFWMGCARKNPKKSEEKRTACYKRLAEEMNISLEDCHFAYFSKEQLEEACTILCRWWRELYDN